MKTLSICRFNNKHDNVPKKGALTWEKWKALFQQRELRTKKDGRLFSPTVYKPNTTRESASIAAISCLVLDGDHAGKMDDFRAIWDARGLAYIVYSTFSHTPEEPRWRVIFPFTEPVVVNDPEEWKRRYEACSCALGGSLMDKNCKDASRMHYLPACLPDMADHAFCIVAEGRALDPDEIPLPESPKPAPVPTRLSRRVTRNDAERILDTLVDRACDQGLIEREGGRHPAALWLVEQLRDNMSEFGYSEGEARAAMMQYQQSVANRYPGKRTYTWKEAEKMFNDIIRTPARSAWERREAPCAWLDKPEPSANLQKVQDANLPVENPPIGGFTFPSDDVTSDIPEVTSMSEISDIPDIPEEEKTDLSDSLDEALRRMARRIKRQGGIPDACGLTIPQDLDTENLIEIGKAISEGDGRINTLLKFAWGDWYRACQAHEKLSRVKGRMGFILRKVFGLSDSFAVRAKQQELSEAACIIGRIREIVPHEQRDMARSWTFYDLLSQLHEYPERQAHYWAQNRFARGLHALMQEEIEQNKKCGMSDKNLLSTIPDSTQPTHPAGTHIVNRETADVIPVDPSMFAVMQSLDEEGFREFQAMRADAMQRGMELAAYLRAVRTGQPLPDPLPRPEYPPNTPNDDGMCAEALWQAVTRHQEEPLPNVDPPIIEQIGDDDEALSTPPVPQEEPMEEDDSPLVLSPWPSAPPAAPVQVEAPPPAPFCMETCDAVFEACAPYPARTSAVVAAAAAGNLHVEATYGRQQILCDDLGAIIMSRYGMLAACMEAKDEIGVDIHLRVMLELQEAAERLPVAQVTA